MPWRFTPLLFCLKRCHACDQWPSSRVPTFLTGCHREWEVLSNTDDITTPGMGGSNTACLHSTKLQPNPNPTMDSALPLKDLRKRTLAGELSNYTFMLHLADCASGGATVLLDHFGKRNTAGCVVPSAKSTLDSATKPSC
jgi:hypothetical protein